MNTFEASYELAKILRKSVISMAYEAQASHIRSCLSIADILAVLYGKILSINPKNPQWSDRDRFILSKGHGGGYFLCNTC